MITLDAGTWGLFAVGAAAGCAWLLLAVTFEAASTSFSALLAALLRLLAPAAVAGAPHNEEQPQVENRHNNPLRRRGHRSSPEGAAAQADVTVGQAASPVKGKGVGADRSDSDMTVLSSIEVDSVVAAQQHGSTPVLTTNNATSQQHHHHHHHHHRSRNSSGGAVADVKANLTGDVAELIEATGPHSHGRSRSHHARVVASSNKGGQAIPQEQSTGDAGDVCACEDGGKGPDSDLPRPDASLLNTQPSAGLPSGNGASLAVIPAPSPTSDSSGGMGAIRRSHQAARLVQSLRQQAAQHHAGIVNADVSDAHASAAAMYARILAPAPYVSRRQRQQVCLKVPNNEPHHLREDILPALDMVLKQYRHSGPPLSVASVCVREGCVSLVINLARMRGHGNDEGTEGGLVDAHGTPLPLTADNVQAWVAALLEREHRPPCTIEEISETAASAPAVTPRPAAPPSTAAAPAPSSGLRGLLPSIFTGRNATSQAPVAAEAGPSGSGALGFMSEPLPRIQTCPTLPAGASPATPSSSNWKLWAQDCQTGTLSCLSYSNSSGWTEEVALGPASTPSAGSVANESDHEAAVAFGGARMSGVGLAVDEDMNNDATEPLNPSVIATASHPSMITPAARIMEVTPRVVQGPPLASQIHGRGTPRILKFQLALTHAASVEVSRASGGEGHPSPAPTPAPAVHTPNSSNNGSPCECVPGSAVAPVAAHQAPLLSIRARTSSGLSCPVEVLQLLDDEPLLGGDLAQAMRESKVKIGVSIPPGCTACMIILELWAPVTLLATGRAFSPSPSSTSIQPLPTLLQDQVTVLMVPSPSRRFIPTDDFSPSPTQSGAGAGAIPARSRGLAEALLSGALGPAMGPVGPGSGSSGRPSPSSSRSYARSESDSANSSGLNEEVAVSYGSPIPGPEPGEWVGVCSSNTSGLPCLCSAQQALYEELASLAEAEAQWARIAGAAGLASADGATAGGNVVHVRGLGADAAGPVGVAHVDMPGTGTEALLWDVGEVLDCMACCMARLPRQHPELDDGLLEGPIVSGPLNDLNGASAACHAAMCTTPSSLACAAEVAAGLLEHGSRHGLPGLADVAGRALQLIHEVHLSLTVNIPSPLRASGGASGAGPSRAPKPRPGSSNSGSNAATGASGSAAPRPLSAPAGAGAGITIKDPVVPAGANPPPPNVSAAVSAPAACPATGARSCCCGGPAGKAVPAGATKQSVKPSTPATSSVPRPPSRAGHPLLWALACLLALALLACCVCFQPDDSVAAPLITAMVCLLGVLAVRARRSSG